MDLNREALIIGITALANVRNAPTVRIRIVIPAVCFIVPNPS